MKTFQITNLIGILCILFGAQHLLTGTMMVVMSGIHNASSASSSVEASNLSRWMQIWNYAGLFVNLVYLLAGVFFLLKRSFSLRLMYSALILSLVSSFVFIAGLALRPGGEFPWQLINVFFLMGPAIDILILIAVYRISRYYLTDPDQEIYIFVQGELQSQTLKWISIGGLLLVFIPFSIFILWFQIARMELSYTEKIAQFQQYFPVWLQGMYRASYLGLFSSVVAFTMSNLGLRLREKAWRRLNTTVMIFSLLMGMIFLWSMM